MYDLDFELTAAGLDANSNRLDVKIQMGVVLAKAIADEVSVAIDNGIRAMALSLLESEKADPFRHFDTWQAVTDVCTIVMQTLETVGGWRHEDARTEAVFLLQRTIGLRDILAAEQDDTPFLP